MSNPALRILEGDVKAGTRPLVTEIAGPWAAGTASWALEIEAVSRKGEKFRTSLYTKP